MINRRHFVKLAGAGLGALLVNGSGADGELIAEPSSVYIDYGAGLIKMKGNGTYRHEAAMVTINKLQEVTAFSPAKPLYYIVLEWNYKTPVSSLVLGDHWERTYGDVAFRSPDHTKKLPWYFIQYDNKTTHCFGVKTGCASLAAWQILNGKLRLILDVRNGGSGVVCGERKLRLATIVTLKKREGSVFETARKFCAMMCEKPLLPSAPVYGINDWYITYGKNSAQIILDHTALMAQFIPDNDNPPFSVVDSGWAEYSPLMPEDCCWQQDFSRSNHHFPDMEELAAGIRRLGMRPGIWMRPLCAKADDNKNRLLPLLPGRNNPKKPVLDPTIAENILQVRKSIAACKNWGFELIKHDFSTNDMFGKWGFDMLEDVTTPGWSFNDRSRTNAEIILDLYNNIREEAGSTYLLGCNTMSHLSAGIFEINRIGDDTSGKEWERTRKMGVNTMGFRMIQHNTFYSADGDCVGLTDKISWEKNKQWMELLAKSSAPLFISAQKEMLGAEQKQAIKESFRLASQPLPVAEPLDWLGNILPSEWNLNGRITRFSWVILLIIFSFGTARAQQNPFSIVSPDNRLGATVGAGKDISNLITGTFITANKLGPYLNFSLGLKLTDFEPGVLTTELQNTPTVTRTWKPLFGEREMVPEHYNESSVIFKAKGEPVVRLVLRMYNEGFAYRYQLINKNKPIIVDAENGVFSIPAGAMAWVSNTAQGVITKTPLRNIGSDAERPLTTMLSDNLYLAFGEAALIDYPRMKFSSIDSNFFRTRLFGPAEGRDSLQSPWRYIHFGTSPAHLLWTNYFIENLNEPNVIKDPSWVKPGKVLRETTLTTAGAMRSIDFAAAHKLQYILFDAGWYGREDHDSSDAKRVSLDPLRSKGPLDLQAAIAYGKKKNVGVILYVNRRALERQMDTLFPLYQKWGVEGVKFGFVQMGSQAVTSWLHKAVRLAAAHKLMVDIHDEYRPTGYSRTYPNLLTQEGIRGDEETIPTEQTIKTLFTRMLAGPADNTFCYFVTSRVNKMGSHAAQMAKTVCIYSPLQFLYWYDKPYDGKGSDTAEGVLSQMPELKWFDNLPVTWNETRILRADMEKFVTIARRTGNSWWIGALNGTEAAGVDIDFNFLANGKTYKATIYTDDPAVKSRTHVKVSTKNITRDSKLSFPTGARNGLAIHIVPLK